MLYQLTTGKLPFEADNPLEVITQHLHALAVPPRAKNDAIPPGLDALILQLMGKEPEERPASAAEVREVIERLSNKETELSPDQTAHKEFSLIDRIVRGRITGRKRELDEAGTYWRRARNGEGQVLLISGEPGIGKTRLVREIATLVEVSGGMVLTGECFAEGSAPYAPIAQMIREVLKHGADHNLPNLVLADLIKIAPDLQSRYPDVPSNPALDPVAEQQRLYESVVSFCITLSDNAPLLLFLDDVHWADSGTLYLVRYLARRLQKSPSLLIATYREFELSETHPFQGVIMDLSRSHRANRIKLSRLGREETEAMLEALFAEGMPAEFLDGIYRETEGNPFFTEEVCKALVESGKLYFEDGIWQRPSMDELEIPQSIRSAVQSRITRLSPDTQKVLLLAAVIGREFDFEPLFEISELADEALLDSLDEAREAQLIAEIKATKGDGFSFVHALIPTTLRGNLSGLRRGRIHRKVAAVIEKLHPHDYESLAYHYGETGDEAQALTYLTQAARQAQQVYANEDALRHYSEALDLIPEEHPERFDLLAARAQVFDLLGRREEQLADIEEMQSLAKLQGDQSRQVDALIALTDHYLATEAWDVTTHTQALAERAVEIARQVDDPVQEAHALRRMGMVARRKTEWRAGREWLQEAATLFRDNAYPGEAAACLNDLREFLEAMHKNQEAQRISEEALTLSQETGDRRQEAISLRSLAYAYLNQNEPDQALPRAEAALEINHQMGDLAEESATLQAIGLVLFKLGQDEKAIRHLRQSLEQAELLGFDRITWQATSEVLNLDYRVQCKYQSGLAFLDERLSVVRSVEEEFLNKTIFVAFNYHKVEMLEYMGRYAEALQIVNEFLPIAEDMEMLVPGFLSFLDRLHAELGQPEEALRSLEIRLELEASNLEVLFSAAYVAWLRADPDGWPVALERAQAAINIARKLDYRQLVFALDMGARLSLASNESEDALTYMQELMQWLKIAPEIYGREQIYFTYSQALRATGQQRDADEALSRAYEWLMRIAEQTEDDVLRRSLLENVPYNREIVAAAKERGIAG